MSHQNLKFAELLRGVRYIPVLVIEDPIDAVPLAEDLLSNGYKVLEITLRTPAALDAMQLIRESCPDAIVGVGTVTNEKQLREAYDAGAQFAVSPGTTNQLVEAANHISIPFLPGVSTTSEAMKLSAQGYQYMKLFPAQAINGLAVLKSIYGPLPDLKFCPTGGLNEKLANEYLKLPNVICVGGSWMCSK